MSQVHEVTMPSKIPEAMADASENIDIVKHLHILILLAFTQLEF